MNRTRRVRLPATGQEPLVTEAGGKQPRPKTKKRVQVTTLEAYRKVLPTMGRRWREVGLGIIGYIDAHYGEAKEFQTPTSYELFHWLKERGQAFDISGVRSVLTMMRDAELIESPWKRVCSVTGERVMAWRPKLNHTPADVVVAAAEQAGVTLDPATRERLRGGTWGVGVGDRRGSFTDEENGGTRPKSLATRAQEFVARFNEEYPVGSLVWVKKDTGEEVESVVRSEAWIVGTASVLVRVDGWTGGFLATRLRHREGPPGGAGEAKAG